MIVAMCNSLFRVTLFCACCLCWTVDARAVETKPNIVLFYADDLGYADLHCFGGQQMSTPNLDQLAASGMRLTSFYAAQAVCSASRSALLTGCYNVRVGILGALGPGSKTCLNPSEVTIAELVKSVGYRTAIFGKWHLGDRDIGLPLNHGFDTFDGLPYSNDMWPLHPTAKNFPPLPLFHDDRVVNANLTAADQRLLTAKATEHACKFVEQNKSNPFFIYVPFNMPHVPIFTSPQFQEKTGNGLYADVIAEIDWSVGQVVDTLRQHDLLENTLIWFSSDNGPWLSYGDHAGSAGPLREGKGTSWEGGVRVPSIVNWPGKIRPASDSDVIAATIDILPTLSEITGANLPDHPLDGLSLLPLLTGKQTQSPHQAFYYYWNNELQAVRSGPWKLHFPHTYRSLKNRPGTDGLPGDYIEKNCGLELYNLESDVGEKLDVAQSHPEIVQRLQLLADGMRAQLGDSLRSQVGTGVRPAGSISQ